MAKKIRTVRGDIAPEQLGFTSMHDHSFCDLSILGESMAGTMPPLPEEMLQFTPENYGFLKSGMFLHWHSTGNASVHVAHLNSVMVYAVFFTISSWQMTLSD